MREPNPFACGAANMQFPVPKSFFGVYPVSCACEKLAGSPWVVSQRQLGLLLYILDGSGEVREDGRVLPYAPNQVLAAPDASRPELCPATETKCLYLLLQNAGPLLEHTAISLQENTGVGTMLASLYRDACGGLIQDVFTASARVYALLMELRRGLYASRPSYSELVGAAMAIIREEYARLSGIDELAERLEVSKCHLVRRFSAEAGKGPGRYLQEVRLERAKLLLTAQPYSVDFIAQLAGYAGANYFCKVFRKEFGVSPERYREQHGSPRPDLENRLQLREMDDIHVL